MTPVEPAPPLIFPAPPRRRARRLLVLLGILLLSALAHAVTFYIIQVAYTPVVTLAPPPAEVTLLAPASAENQALNRWLAIADPSLISQPAGPGRDLAALSFRYVPSYASAPPAYRPLELTAPPAPPPPGDIFSPAPLPPLAAAPRSPAPAAPSRVILDSALGDLALQPLPPLKLSLKTVGAAAKPLDATVFLVGARAEGGVPFVFRQESSGNPLVDEYARAYLSQLDYRPGPAPVTWGWASFRWGAEIYR